MHDAPKIIVGLLVFVAMVSFPLWYNSASGRFDPMPELQKPVDATDCVAETEYMTVNHMDLLNDWRDRVVREGERLHVDHLGRHYEMSLTRTCLSCHTERDNFCDRCHDYMGVEPFCWDCHVTPEEVR